MSVASLGFLIAGLLAFFVFALAVQMRLLAGAALKRAAQAQVDGLEDGPARFAVANAVKEGADTLEAGDEGGDAARYLGQTYPAAIGHMRLARRVSRIMPVVLIAIAIGWRIVAGG